MAITDESEDPPEPLSERARARGWHVISNPSRRPDPEADELKTLIRGMRVRRRARGVRKADETDPPEAA
jgi:hypothetical protein